MSLTILLSPQEEARLQEKAAAEGLPIDSFVRTMLLPAIGNPPKNPKKSGYGALAHLGQALTEKEIDDNRTDMFASFGREDIS